MKPEQAEQIAILALTWLASNEDLLPVFLGASGANAEDLRAQAENPAFLGSVLEFITMDDAWVVEFCDLNQLKYEQPLQARYSLHGAQAVPLDMTKAVGSSTIRGVVFDKDGTLFDFNATWGAWARRVLEAETAHRPDALGPLAEALGYDLKAGLFRKDSIVIANTVHEIVAAAMPIVGETSADAMIARFNAAATSAPQIEAAPLIPFVKRLRAAGLKLGVATNDAEGPARAHLAKSGVEDLFDFVVGSDSGFGGKPAAGQLIAFCQAVDLPPDDCVMVGDSTHDLRAGRAAGMTTIAVLTGVAAREDLAPFADHVLNSIADLPDWLGLATP